MIKPASTSPRSRASKIRSYGVIGMTTGLKSSTIFNVVNAVVDRPGTAMVLSASSCRARGDFETTTGP